MVINDIFIIKSTFKTEGKKLRSISIQHSDFDKVENETWYELKTGFLLTPHVAMEIYNDNILIYSLEEAIAEDATVVFAETGKLIALEIFNSSIEGLDVETLSQMSFADLAMLIASRA